MDEVDLMICGITLDFISPDHENVLSIKMIEISCDFPKAAGTWGMRLTYCHFHFSRSK